MAAQSNRWASMWLHKKHVSEIQIASCVYISEHAGVERSGKAQNTWVYGRSINPLALRGMKVPQERRKLWAASVSPSKSWQQTAGAVLNSSVNNE